jgi:Phospholipase_D-nuclease N-terminal
MDWSFGDVLLAMCVFFAWILWFWLLFAVFGDLFRRHDIGGGAKAGWIVFVIFVPVLGCFIYLIAQGRDMTERSAAEAQASKAEFDAQVRAAAGSNGAAAEIEKGKKLLDSGAISQAEFDALKARALAE